MKLDKVRVEEWELQEIVLKSQEENSYIQRQNSSMSSKNGQWKGKIKELEFEIDLYRTRAMQAKSLTLVKHHVSMLQSKEESSKKCVLPTTFVATLARPLNNLANFQF